MIWDTIFTTEKKDIQEYRKPIQNSILRPMMVKACYCLEDQDGKGESVIQTQEKLELWKTGCPLGTQVVKRRSCY